MGEYDRFAEKYIKIRHKGFSPNKHIELPAMLKILGNIKDKKILDLGCGFGEHAKIYSRKGAKITGIDSSKKEIAYAKLRKIGNTNFIVGDILKKLPFRDNSFDIITSSLVLDYIKNLKKLFKECRRVLKKSGKMIFSIPNPIFYQESPIAGLLKEGKKSRIFGNYFKRRKIKQKWRSGIITYSYHKTLEDFFSAIIQSGFQLENFKEAKPIPSSKNLDNVFYEFASKNPYFIFFEIKLK